MRQAPPRPQNRKNRPVTKPKSPIRLTTNAFMPARALPKSVYQKPMSRYEHSPTPSQPKNRITKLSPSTSSSIENTNRLRYEKKRQ